MVTPEVRFMQELDEDPPESLTGDSLTRWFDHRNRRALRGLYAGQLTMGQKLDLGVSLVKVLVYVGLPMLGGILLTLWMSR